MTWRSASTPRFRSASRFRRTPRSSFRLPERAPAALRVGIDAGGTFTDVVAEGPDGSLVVDKLPSTPDDPGRAVVAAERAVAGENPVGVVCHGTTVATNAFLEGRASPVGLIVSRGFEDVLTIGRQRRRRLYSLAPEGCRRIVPEARVRSVPERTAASGEIVEPLDVVALDRVADDLLRAGAETIVVAFLHSARHPEHERTARDHLRGRGRAVVATHEVTSEPREYERWATAVVDAGLTPIMGRYLTGLAGRLKARELRVLLSSGGTAPAAEAAGRAVSTILSGPAGGVVGARLVGRAAGFDRLITFDMGGTSCDVAVVPGEPLRTTEAELDDVPLRVPLIDIQTVGAGGGSIAWTDRGGALRVGPRSAGADPGPAAYGAGGKEPTLTDAHLVLGHLEPSRFLGGRRPLDPGLAERAIDRVAGSLGAERFAAAAAVVAVARGHLERAVRRVTLERGYDPADFTLVAFGGAGGLHAADLAGALGCSRVLIPRAAGVLSALGCLAADVRRDFGVAVLERATPDSSDALEARFAELERRAARALADEGVEDERRRVTRGLALRYRGQSYEIEVPCERETDPVAAFHRAHAERYGYARPEAEVEIVAARVAAVGLGHEPTLPDHRPEGESRVGERIAWIGGRPSEIEAWIWDALPAGHRGRGPTLVFGDHATVLVPPGWSWSVDPHGNVVLEAEG